MTTPSVPPIALAGEPPICDVIDVLFSQKAAWTSELGYAINSSDFRHLLEKTGGIHAPTPSASSVPVELPERVIDKLYQDAGVSSYHPDGDQQEALHAFARAVIVEAFARLPDAAPSPSASSVPEGFVLIDKELLAQTIACNTDASTAEAKHIINTVLKTSDDEIYRATLLDEQDAPPPANPAPSVLTDEQIFKAVGEVNLLAAQHRPWPECTAPLRVLLQANGATK